MAYWNHGILGSGLTVLGSYGHYKPKDILKLINKYVSEIKSVVASHLSKNCKLTFHHPLKY